MHYCEGKNCSRRYECAFHEVFDWKYPRQYLDDSTNGHGFEGIDSYGNRFSEHIWFCGDNANHYGSYKALGWREGQEYKNSLGFCYDEVCVNCEHRNLCFCLLENASMITYEGKRVMDHICEDVKANPEEHREQLIRNGWREELL